jgi:hypothetical protein
MPLFSRAGPVSAWALTVALVLSVLVLGLVGFAPTYSTSSSSASVDATTGVVTSSETVGTASLVAVNGAWVLGMLAVPLVVTLLVGVALVRRHVVVAWLLFAPLAALTMLGMMSIGIFLLPVTVCLFVACLTVRQVAPVDAEPLPL